MSNIVEVISSTKAIIKVEKQVKIYVKHDHSITHGGIYFDVDLTLSRRGTDFNVYANRGYEENVKDSDLLVAILNGLFTPRSGVVSVSVSPFSFCVNKSSTVDAESVIEAVLDAANRAGYKVEFRNLAAEERARYAR